MAVITTAELSVDEVMSALADPASGGVSIFVGRVRDHDEGRAVALLTYEPHPSAEDVMAEVCRQIATDHDAVVGAIHRVGELAVGDVAVIVAAASAHRSEAFGVCRALIDAVKDQVPIWKHQHFSDGTQQWVGSP